MQKGSELRRWDSRLGERLGTVTHAAPLTPDAAPRTIELVRTYGFAIVESPPAADGQAVATRRAELLAFGGALGVPVVQSPRQELVEDVKDYSDREPHDDRGYRSGGELAPHSDPPTLLLLHCLQPAREGGYSSLVSVASVVERIEAESPGSSRVLFDPFPAWRVAGQHGRAEAGPDDEDQPVLTEHDGELSCVLYRPYIEMAATASGRALSTEQVVALDSFERASQAPDLTLRFTMQPGQTVVLHNRSVLHARTEFRDWPELDRRRHLLRMWIDSPPFFPVHPAHELGDLFALAPDRT